MLKQRLADASNVHGARAHGAITVGFGYRRLTVLLVDRPPPLGNAPKRLLVRVAIAGYVARTAGAVGHLDGFDRSVGIPGGDSSRQLVKLQSLTVHTPVYQVPEVVRRVFPVLL